MKRHSRKALVAMAVAALLSGAAVGTIAAKAPKGKITLKACGKKKPPVVFDHGKHVKLTKKNCATCHHNVKGKPATEHKCSSCHTKKQGKMSACSSMSKKKNPYHNNCITCHKKHKDKAPTKCKECHKK